VSQRSVRVDLRVTFCVCESGVGTYVDDSTEDLMTELDESLLSLGSPGRNGNVVCLCVCVRAHARTHDDD